MAPAATHRIAVVIVRCLDLHSPPCTLPELGKSGGAAPSTIQMWCGTLGLHARDIVLFARGLWAVYWAPSMDAAPQDLLGFAERRSLKGYLARSGSLGGRSEVMSTETFCTSQSFIVNRQILAEVLRLLAARASA